MSDGQLRTRLRALISSGDLPSEPPAAHAGSGARLQAEAPSSIGVLAQGRCLICAQPGAQTTYELPDGRWIRIHRTPCDVAWRDEAARRRQGDIAPQGIALPKDPFIQWLDGRLAQDADFETRMEVALKELRVERIAAAIHAVRSRAKRPESSAG